MPRSEARLKVSIWNDPAWRELSQPAQWLYMTLLSQGDVSMCGVMPFLPARWEQLCSGDSHVEYALDDLRDERWVLVDEATHELLIRTFVVHDGVLRSPKTRQPMWRALDSVLSDDLAQEVFDLTTSEHRVEAVRKHWSSRIQRLADTPSRTDDMPLSVVSANTTPSPSPLHSAHGPALARAAWEGGTA